MVFLSRLTLVTQGSPILRTLHLNTPAPVPPPSTLTGVFQYTTQKQRHTGGNLERTAVPTENLYALGQAVKNDLKGKTR